MFRQTTSKFRLQYYLSNLLLSLSLFLSFIILNNIDHTINLRVFSEKKFAFLILLMCWFISLYSLKRLKKTLNSTANKFSTNKTIAQASFSRKFNPGFRDFLLSNVLPLTFTFSFNDSPISSCGMFCVLNIFMYFFYKNSSDFLPNLSLMLFGNFSIVPADFKGKEIYVFVNTTEISDIIGAKSAVMFIEGTQDKTKQVALVVTENGKIK
ncbi:hypothetical protein [Leuconostoc mesenteroides]|uniref:hypothetical protein n=1 Tax=Leuconostoc mesenteroides TaxID=1245 RepID=UPI001144CC3D|nr:hypothetical protein [Leuconostoc mesenteroides]